MTQPPAYHGTIPDSSEFMKLRSQWRSAMASDDELHVMAVNVLNAAEKHKFCYQWEWCGVPVIKTPDDIVVLQELIWNIRPSAVIETGIARGGGLALAASLMAGAGLAPRVLGLDVSILGHTRDALMATPWFESITLVQADSASERAASEVRHFLECSEESPVILVLDSDHSHNHVLAELRNLSPLLPSGSHIIVADTIVEEIDTGDRAARPWHAGDSPLTALQQFLDETQEFAPSREWGRRALISECRDGYLRKL